MKNFISISTATGDKTINPNYIAVIESSPMGTGTTIRMGIVDKKGKPIIYVTSSYSKNQLTSLIEEIKE
jgi:hypothetical protein